MTTPTKQSAYVPTYDRVYVPYGNFFLVREVIKSGKFFPIWITGNAGCGKTQMIEQAAASAGFPDGFFDTSEQERFEKLDSGELPDGRELIRINFTSETDESQLIGSFRLKNGETIYEEGPVVRALRRGAILLLDEVDAGHQNRILVLQSVLEGRGVYIKETCEWVKAAKGFQIFATSNTRGRGSDSGKFTGLSIMNAAFLDRFAITIEQKYPEQDDEAMIILKAASEFLDVDADDVTEDDLTNIKTLISDLVAIAADTRVSFNNGATDEVLTTRSLIAIMQGFFIIGNARKAFELSCQRFNEQDCATFMSYYDKLIGAKKKYDISFLKKNPNLKKYLSKSSNTEEFIIRNEPVKEESDKELIF